MKSILLFLPLLTFAVLAGCKDKDAESYSGGAEAVAKTEEHVEGTESYLTYPLERKLDLQNRVQDDLSKLDQQIVALRVKAQQASADPQSPLQTTAAELNARSQEIRAQLESISMATTDNWEDLRAELKKKIDDLTKACQDLGQRIR